MADFGKDIKALPDIGATLGLQEGNANLAEAIARRLITPRGGLFYDASYGLDVRLYLNESLTDSRLQRIAADIEGEVEKDPRINTAEATVTAPTLDSMRIELELDTAEGPFDLVLSVSQVNVSILRVEAA